MTFLEDDPAVEARVSKGVDVASGGSSEPVGGGGSRPTATMAALQMSTREATTNTNFAIRNSERKGVKTHRKQTQTQYLQRGDTKNTIRQFLNNRRDLKRNSTYPKKPGQGTKGQLHSEAIEQTR